MAISKQKFSESWQASTNALDLSFCYQNGMSHIGTQFEPLNEKQSHSPSRAVVNLQPTCDISD